MAVLAWRDKLEPPDWDLLWQFSARLQQDIEMREATGDGKTDDGLRTLCALDDVLAKVRRWLQ